MSNISTRDLLLFASQTAKSIFSASLKISRQRKAGFLKTKNKQSEDMQ
jgi:hypothetical protein